MAGRGIGNAKCLKWGVGKWQWNAGNRPVYELISIACVNRTEIGSHENSVVKISGEKAFKSITFFSIVKHNK